MSYTDIPELYRLFKACEQKITTDTRKIEKGCLFFALKGDRFDANDFIPSALEQGCAYAVSDRADAANDPRILVVPDVLTALQQLAKHHRKTLGIPVIGITGSNGKTTNKELIHAVLATTYSVYATKGNLNNHIGVPLSLLALTPQHEMAIIEMGANHQGEIAFLSTLAEPDYGLITNIGKAHMEGFGGVEGIKKGKGELYRHLRAKQGLVFVNGDDAVLMQLSEGLDRYLYGEDPGFEVHGRQFPDSEYVTFKWNTKGRGLEGEELVRTHMFGHYNFINMLCAAAIGHYFKVPPAAINQALASYLPEMNRSQVMKTARNTLILDAYNANPSSMALAVKNFAQPPLNGKLLILGDMFELGTYAAEEHRNILEGSVALGLERLWLVGGLFFQFREMFPQYRFFSTADEVADYLRGQPVTGSTILIKGSRGMRLEGLTDCL